MYGLSSIALLALLMAGPISVFACTDDNDDTTKILFGSPARDRGTDYDDIDWLEFCEKNPNVIPCNHNDIPTPPTQEPEPPLEDCSHEGEGLDVCRPVEDGDDDRELEEEEPTPEESHHNTDVHDEPE